MPDHNGQTRAERNALANHPVPEVVVPPEGAFLWGVFWRASEFREDRGRIAPGMMRDWLAMNGARLSTLEARVIEAMDRAWVSQMAEEVAFNEERRNRLKGGR